MKHRNITALFLALMTVLFSVLPALAVRTDIAVKTPVSINGTIAADAADVPLTAADASNLNSCTHTGREMILAFNSGASSRTVTITSVADRLGRVGHISAYSLAAGEYAVFGPFPVDGWRQTDGKLYFEANHAEVKFLVLRIPSTF